MSGLPYVGVDPATGRSIVSKTVTDATLAAAVPNQASVQTQVNNITQVRGDNPNPTYAPQGYVNNQDATFRTPNYYYQQDALNLPQSAVGVAKDWRLFDATWRTNYQTYLNGVTPGGSIMSYVDWLATQPVSGTAGTIYGAASLVSGTIPLAQLPVMGEGYLKGPYSPTPQSGVTYTGTTSNTPMKIADWNIGNQSLSFRPLVFCQVFCQSAMGRPIVEVKIANSTTPVTYAAGITVAMGEGRTVYNDYHSLVVMPAPDGVGQTPTPLPSGYNVWLTAWIYDATSQNVTLSSGGLVGAWAGLLRTAQ